MGDTFEPLEDFLDSLRDDGRKESSGEFTLDSLRALEKMAGSQMASPYEYVLKLVQAAIATEVAVTASGSSVTVLFDTAPLRREHMHDLPRWILQPCRQGPDRYLTHLAIGLNAALALNPTEVEVVSSPGHTGVGFRFRRDAQGERTEKLLADRRVDQRTRITLKGLQRVSRRLTGPAWAGWMDSVESRSLGDYGAEARSLWDSEFSQVWRRCLLAPVPLTLNGRAVNRPFMGGPKQYTAVGQGRTMSIRPPNPGTSEFARLHYLVAPGFSAGVLPGPVGYASASFSAQSEFPAPHVPPKLRPAEGFCVVPKLRVEGAPKLLQGQACLPCFACLGKRTSLRPRGWLTFVHDGVVLSKRMHTRKALEEWCVLATAAHLKTDLSEFGLVEHEDYLRTLNYLEFVCQKL